MAYNGNVVEIDEDDEDPGAWQVAASRKQRRQMHWADGADHAASGKPLGNQGNRRQLPPHLMAPTMGVPPWRQPNQTDKGGGKGGGKKGGGKGKGKPVGRPQTLTQPPPWTPQQDYAIPCGNPDCPGYNGTQSFKYANKIGKGQFGWHCMGCRHPWTRSWHIFMHGSPPPAPSRQPRREEWEDDDDEELSGSPFVNSDAREWSNPGGKQLFQSSPAFNLLDESYKIILGKVLDMEEVDREKALEHFRTMEDQDTGKAVVAAYVEQMAKRQAAVRPILKHPAGHQGPLLQLTREKNKAEKLSRQSTAVSQKQIAILELKEKLAIAEKEMGDAVEQAEAHAQAYALATQALAAGMASKERQLLQGAAEPAKPDLPAEAKDLCHDEKQRVQLESAFSQAFGKLLAASQGGTYQKAIEALGLLSASFQGHEDTTPATAGGVEKQAPSPTTAQGPGETGGPVIEKVEEVDMQAADGKKRVLPDDGLDREKVAAESLFEEEVPEQSRGRSRSPREKTAKAFCPTVAQTIKDTEAVMRLIKDNPAGNAGAASSQQSR